MRSIALAALVVGLAGTGCQALKCSPVSGQVTGDPAADLVGTWSDFGTDSPVVFDFRNDGKVRIIEAPNMYSPGGSVSVNTYSVNSTNSTWTIGTGTPTPFTVTETTLEETPAGATTPRSHPRVSCTGFGFAQ